MPSDKIDSIFQAYSKLKDKNKMNVEGRGLGLSIVKQIVESMAGNIKVTSEIGFGTTFTLNFSSMSSLKNQMSRSMSAVNKSQIRLSKGVENDKLAKS